MEALANFIIKKQLCKVIRSNIEGTPDMKMIGIFSENKPEWFMTELACCSDSICIVPVAVQDQFFNEHRVFNILDITEIQTLCVSRKTIGLVLDLKAKNKLKHLQNIILFDTPEDIHITLATQVGFHIYSFHDMVSEGYRMLD